MNSKSDLFNGINTDSTHYDHWITAGAGISGVGFAFIITKKYAPVELSIAKSSELDNKAIFDKLFSDKDIIEKTFGTALSWQRLDGKKMCRITYILDNVNIFNTDDWTQIQDFLITNMIKFNDTLKPYIANIKKS